MRDNPYAPAKATASSPAYRRWNVLASSGVSCIVLAMGCAAASVAMMIHSFDAIATSSSTPEASEITEAISTSLIPAYAIVPLGLVGLVLIVVGSLPRRRPAQN